MAYDISKSDSNKPHIAVPDMPPGLNTADTSLSLIGKNYPNFGQKLAENFVHLLENFASPIPPNNPIEGQLWYNTANQEQKTLYVFDGQTWAPPSGVHHSPVDPHDQVSPTVAVALGDIWVDQGAMQVKLWNGSSWTLIGPGLDGATLTGSYPTQLQGSDGKYYSVILMYIEDNIVEIITTSAFTPIDIIDGFINLVPGVNISTKKYAGSTPQFTGISNAALNLKRGDGVTVSANNVVRNDVDQKINGLLVINNNAGVRIGGTTATFAIQKGSILNNTSDAAFSNSIDGGRFVFQITKNQISNPVMLIDGGNFDVSLGKANIPVSLTVSGITNLSQKLTVQVNNDLAVDIAGGVKLKNLSATGTVTVNSLTNLTGLVTLGVTGTTAVQTAILPATDQRYDLGSLSSRFATIYSTRVIADQFGSTVTNAAQLNGSAQYLTNAQTFSVYGQVASTGTIAFDGRQAVQFNATLTNSAITAQPLSTLASQPVQQLDKIVFSSVASAQLHQTSKQDFLADLFGPNGNQNSSQFNDIIPPGTVLLYAGSTVIDPITHLITNLQGWVLCDGYTQFLQSGPPLNRLFSVIGATYGSVLPGTYFTVPNIPSPATGTNYIIKL